MKEKAPCSLSVLNDTKSQLRSFWALLELQGRCDSDRGQSCDAGKLAEAREATKAALDLTKQPSVVYQWYWQLGHIEEKLGTSNFETLQYYDKALKNMREVRDDLLHIGPDVQFDFRRSLEPIYHEYLGLLIPKNTETTADTVGGLDQITAAQAVIQDLRTEELESFLACGLREGSAETKMASIQDIADTESERHTAILYPIILENRLEVLIKLPGEDLKRYPSREVATNAVYVDQPLVIPFPGLENTSQDTTDQTIEAQLEQLRIELEKPYFSSNRGRPLAQQFYDWLVRPAEEWGAGQQNLLEGIDTLVFVLDGPLRSIPMAALYDYDENRDPDQNKFLIEKYAVAVTFGELKLPKASPQSSFRVLAAGLSKSPDLSEPSDALHEENPKENSEEDSEENADESVLITSEGVDLFGPLTNVDEEVEAIREIIGNTEILLDENFTSENVRNEASISTYNVVHFATHGVFGFTRNETFLLAADPNQVNQPDETIKAKKINLNDFEFILSSRSRFPIDFLVLSACETATGDDREVLGIAGLSAQLGVRSSLATLWNVSDLSSVEFIDRFYSYLQRENLSKAKAVQLAQIDLLKENTRYRPTHWAPYILVGDWR